MHRFLGGLALLVLLAGAASAAATPLPTAQGPTATVEWTILVPSPPGPARTLLLDANTPGIGPIEHTTCATWAAANHTLTLYNKTTTPLPPGPCYGVVKTIRRLKPDSGQYALTWSEGSVPFFEWLLYPGTTLPVTFLPDGGVAVQLP